MKQNIPLGAVGALLAISMLVIVFLLWPNFQTFSALRNQLQERELELKNLEAYFNQLKQLQEEIASQPAEKLTLIEQSLPDEPSLPSLYEVLSQTASHSGLALRSINSFVGVAAPEAEQGFRTIEVAMEMEGTYEALKEFLLSTRTLPRLLSIKDLKFDSPERGGIFKFSVTLQAYSY
ncbi:MAG: type 4a pilus biogenesis protein PilO [Parcubacteria group bacterium]|nr:type 4a pilus biogenesis protein PilO [Parcubacteria group bacterium]